MQSPRTTQPDARSRAIRQPTRGTVTGLDYFRRAECALPGWIGLWERTLQDRAANHPRFLGGRHHEIPKAVLP